MPRKLTMGEFKARQKAEAWEHAQAQRAARQVTEAKETADTLIEDRGLTNALAWADHCATRSTDGLWRMVRNEIMRQAVMAKLGGAK